MRQQNAGAVLHIIRELGPISRPDIAREAGLSKPTVSNVVKFLSERGYLVEEEMAPTAGEPKSRGPRPRLVSFNARTGYVIGIDTGADNTIGKLSDLAGNVLATHRRKHDAHPDRHRVLADIRQVIADLLRTSGLQASDISALGVGTPGVVDPDTGCVSLAQPVSGSTTPGVPTPRALMSEACSPEVLSRSAITCRMSARTLCRSGCASCLRRWVARTFPARSESFPIVLSAPVSIPIT